MGSGSFTFREYVYSAANRLSAVKQGGAVTMHYGYNGRDERVHRHLGSDITYSVYDEAGHWVGDYDASGAPKQQAIWRDDLPVGLLNGAATASNRLHYIEPDHLGTPRAVIEPQRDVAVWTWDIASEAFGNSAPNPDPDGDSAAFVLDMRFPGQRYDAASGLNYNYFRDYEAGVGRYAQSDPIGLMDGVSTYAYAGSEPLGLLDPFGLSKGGRRNIGVAGFTKKSNPKDVEKALNEAKRSNARKEHIDALRGLLKVIKRGGTMAEGLLPSIMVDELLEDQCGQGLVHACESWCMINPDECEEIRRDYYEGLKASSSCPATLRREDSVSVPLY